MNHIKAPARIIAELPDLWKNRMRDNQDKGRIFCWKLDWQLYIRLFLRHTVRNITIIKCKNILPKVLFLIVKNFFYHKVIWRWTETSFCLCSPSAENPSTRGGLHSVISLKSVFGNQEIGQLELWKFAQGEVLSVVPGKVLLGMCRGGLGAKINQQINLALMWNH